jgi:hypothetical protein
MPAGIELAGCDFGNPWTRRKLTHLELGYWTALCATTAGRAPRYERLHGRRTKRHQTLAMTICGKGGDRPGMRSTERAAAPGPDAWAGRHG